MSNLDFMKSLGDIDKTIEVLRLILIIISTHYTYAKIVGAKKMKINHILFATVSVLVTALVVTIIKYGIDAYYSTLLLLLLVTFVNCINFKSSITDALLITILSFCISYIIYMIAVSIAFFPIAIFKLNNDYVVLIIISALFCFFINRLFKIRKVKNGFLFLKEKMQNSYLNILILNICSIILFIYMVIQDKYIRQMRKPIMIFFSLSIVMFLTIKQSFDLYYKQNLLAKDLEATKKELEEKQQEINKLEKENLEFSKTSHSLAHKQKSLEFKLEKLMQTNIEAESKEKIKEEIKKVSKELYKEPNEVKLDKTGIESIDNMFSFMQSECIKNNIKFELQVVGNIYYMINNLIFESDLEILIADHIKDAIIAINNSDNLNRSILVRIGKIDNVYSLYIYDSGIEFTIEVLDNLGKKPITTHSDTGGTGMGFMNTFDTLNKTKASLIINEIAEPCEDNYTKVLMFKFNKQNEFKVISYKNEVVV